MVALLYRTIVASHVNGILELISSVSFFRFSYFLATVRFATVLTTQTFAYPRVDAVDIVTVYYQDSDYKRFREERRLESLRQSHALRRGHVPMPLKARNRNGMIIC